MNRPFNLRVCPGGSLPGGCGCGTPPPTPPCPPVSDTRAVEPHIFTSGAPEKLALTGGDFFFTGPAQVSVNFSVTFTTDGDCVATTMALKFELLVDGSTTPQAPPVIAAFMSGGSFATASTLGVASFNVPAGNHQIGLQATVAPFDPACDIAVISGSVAVTLNCVNPRVPPTIIGF